MTTLVKKLFSVGLLVAALPLFAGGCGNGGNLGEEPTFSGQFYNWTNGASYVLNFSVAGSPDSPTLASAPIDSAGNFTIKLPPKSAFAQYLQPNKSNLSTSLQPPICSGSVDEDAAQGLVGTARFTATSGTRSLRVDPSFIDGDPEKPTLAISYAIRYYDHDYNVSGDVTCMASGSARYVFNQHDRPGWNIDGITSENLDSPTPTETFATAGFHSGVMWN